MSDTLHPAAVQALARLSGVHPHVYEGVEIGVERARDYFGSEAHDPWLFSHIVRHQTVRLLSGRALAAGYRLRRNPMSGVELYVGGYCVRLWKLPSDGDHMLQPPGESERRQDFYLQRQPDLPGTEYLRPNLLNLVYVWDSSAPGVLVHLVCPSGFDGIWKPGEHLWQAPVAHPAANMTSLNGFSQPDDDDDLPLYLDSTGDEPDPET